MKLTGESKVFEEGQLGEAPGGGSLTTYKELSALATEMGQPDLLYKFMDLANHASAMASTRGAAFGWAHSAGLCTTLFTRDIRHVLYACFRPSEHCMPHCAGSRLSCRW